MNILILVLSSFQPPYDQLFQAQKETWDSICVESIETRYYTASSMEEMPWALKTMLDEVSQRDWTYIFRTNSSSYVDKKMLCTFAETLPKTGCYCGLDGGGFASGSGMFLSRDVVDILRNEIQEEKIEGLVEDEFYGRVFRQHGIGVTPGAKRYDFYYEEFVKQFYHQSQDHPKDHYHFRCKSDTFDRMKDVQAMKLIHRFKTEGVLW